MESDNMTKILILLGCLLEILGVIAVIVVVSLISIPWDYEGWEVDNRTLFRNVSYRPMFIYPPMEEFCLKRGMVYDDRKSCIDKVGELHTYYVKYNRTTETWTIANETWETTPSREPSGIVNISNFSVNWTLMNITAPTNFTVPNFEEDCVEVVCDCAKDTKYQCALLCYQCGGEQ